MTFRVQKCGNFCTLLALFLAATAHADFYTCKDSAGHLLTSDRPIPECSDRAEQVYKSNGALKNQLPSSDQRRLAEQQEQQKAAEALKQDALKREQRYLTAHYPDEASIEVARQKAIGVVEAKIAVETKNIATNTEELRKNENLFNATPKNQSAKIHDLQMQKEDFNQSIAESNRLIQTYKNEEIKINQQFEATHKRYLEIIPAN